MTKSIYTIDEDNNVRLWHDESLINEPPVIFQPFSPDTGQPWESREQAEFWAINCCTQIDIIVDPIEE
jgi:hypothetical protein